MRNDFMFDYKLASNENLMMCHITKEVDFDTLTISKTTFTNVQPAGSDEYYFTGSKYDEPLSKTIQICKIIDCNVVELTNYDVENIQRWLCRDDGYYDFCFINDDVSDLIYKAKIDMSTIELGGKIIGLELTITTNSPYGYTHNKKTIVDFNKDKKSVIIKDFSSKVGKTYIGMVITCNESGDLEVTNCFDNKTMVIKNCISGEVITITDMQVITTDNETHDIANDFNYIYPYIYNTLTSRDNKFEVNMNCNIEFKYKFKRKVGI